MGAQVCKIDRTTGEILSRGYVHPDTRMSESSAECLMDNSDNKDPFVGYVVLESTKEYTSEQVLSAANSEWNVRLGYGRVLDVLEGDTDAL